MIIAKFGAKIFEVSPTRICTPNDFSISGDLNTAENDTDGKKSTLTVKGPSARKVSIGLLLKLVAGINVQSEIDQWYGVLDAGTPWPLIWCGKEVSLNKFLLTGCNASDYVVVPSGTTPVVTEAKLKLDFTEDVSSGTASTAGKKTAAQKAKAAAPGLAGQTVANPYKVPTAAQKSTAKRTGVS